MPITALNDRFTNMQTFVDSCFSDGVRSTETLETAIEADKFVADFTGGSTARLLQSLTMKWRYLQDHKQNKFHNYCRDTDTAFVDFLADFIRTNDLHWFQPIFHQDGDSGGIPVYKLSRYSNIAFRESGKWDYSAVEKFIEYFLYGAHIVIVDSGFTKAKRFYDAFQTKLKGKFNTGAKHSHYAGIISTNGLAFPNTIIKDEAPSECPIICSLLVGTTSREPYCSFIQLEGWPGVSMGGMTGRHAGDYAVHKATKWNISTYGASAYSEKRATAIFLAKKTWNPSPRAMTIMPKYRGAETKQKWLDTKLAKL